MKVKDFLNQFTDSYLGVTIKKINRGKELETVARCEGHCMWKIQDDKILNATIIQVVLSFTAMTILIEEEKKMKYQVTVTETLERVVTVDANSPAEAEEMIEEQWERADLVLDAEDFVYVAFKAERREENESGIEN